VEPVPQRSRLVRFGTFEVDLRAGELRKSGVKLKLTGQPFQVLTILLERPGEVVTRDELQKVLWPDTFVDVDHNLIQPSIGFGRSWATQRKALASSKRCQDAVIASWHRLILSLARKWKPTPW
jgi:DNA-binding response OmpR family regulator